MTEENQNLNNDDQIKHMYNEEIDISLPDEMMIPMPEAVNEGSEAVYQNVIEDDVDVSFKFAFIGAGQGGSRIVQTFGKLGYNRTAVINTAEQDLNTISLKNKLCMGDGGAGKQPELAREKFLERKEDILDFMRYSFGEEFDRIMVCAGGGGGSGSGSVGPLIEAAYDLQVSLNTSSKKVGVILTLPRRSEGEKVHQNAMKALAEVNNLKAKGLVSPLILLDNERISELYPNLSISKFWDTANSSMAGLFHLYNLTSNKDSSYSSFDKNDYKTILDSGTVALGVSPVKNWEDPVALSRTVRDNLKNSLLSGKLDISTGNVAGVIVIAGNEILDKLPQNHIDQALDQLNRILRQGSVVHRGIYSGDKSSLIIFTAIGGLANPTSYR
jgi:cell division GTPase FtsZ